MANNRTVEYEGGRYYITECIMWLDKSEWRYSLKLVEVKEKVNHFVIANIEKVKVIS